MTDNIIYKNQQGDRKLARYLATIREGDPRKAVVAFKNGSISEDILARIFLPYIGRVIKSVWRTYPTLGDQFEPSDFETTIWLLCRRRLVEKFDESRPLTPVVRSMVVNTLNDAIKAQKLRFRLVSVDTEDEDEIPATVTLDKAHLNDESSEEDYGSIDIDEIDSIRATEKICQIVASRNNMGSQKTTSEAGDSMKMPGFSTPRVNTSAEAPVQAKRRDARNKPAPALSKNQQKLVEILERHGWTHTQFASMLGIGMHTLDSYLYGKTKDVPKDVMARAIEIDKEEAPSDKYHNVHMKDVLQGWCKMAGEDYNDNKTLAILCRVSIPTITRWKNGVSRPSPLDIGRAERAVVEFIAKKKRYSEEENVLFAGRVKSALPA